MAVKLTDEQREAVENRGGSLLVSAAAGSGKTKVLVERLFRYILDQDDPANVTDFLIITYTKAAAAELRMKIASELAERLADDGENLHLQRQSMLIYRADVRTVDSFCTNLLRENVHLIGQDEDEFALTPDFRVLDEKEAELIRLQVLERVLENFYENIEENEGGQLLADTIGAGRDDQILAELVLQLFGKLQSHGYPMKWLAEEKAYWEHLPEKIEDTPYGEELICATERQLDYWISVFSDLCCRMEEDEKLAEKYLPAFSLARDNFAYLKDELKKGWDEACRVELTFERLGAVRNGGQLKELAKSLWDSCKKDCEKIRQRFSVSNDDLMKDLRHMAPAMAALITLTEDFSMAYAEEKLRRNVTDFSDQEHFALDLLVDEQGNPTQIGKAVSSRYREIMVDEFQDTNEVQNRVFEAISKDGKNLFMVGDMKQSIYRFRLADPTIFLHHYMTDPLFSEAKGDEERKVLLSKNFRSRQEILDAANFICGNLMSEELGEMAYTEDEALHFGASYYQEKKDCTTEFYLVDHPKNEEQNEEKENRRAAETEARFVAHRIRELLDEPYLVQDENGELRPVREEDIVILMRSPNPRRRIYERVLAEQGISCASEGSSEFFETMEIAVVYAMLQLIDNPHQDVPLIAVLRSPLFSFSPDRLAIIRSHCPREDFYTALCQDEGEDAKAFVTALKELRFLAPDLSVHRLLWHLYNEWNVLGVFGSMDGGAERRAHLIALYEHARSFETAGYRGLFRFVSHLRSMLEAGETLEAASGEVSGGVRLMSIHKSKGLEFPVVILADLHKEFNKSDMLAPVLIHPEMGLGPICVDLERRIRYKTVAQEAVAHRQMQEQKSEEIRVLYVALTRAKEKLIMVASCKNTKGLIGKLLPRASCPVAPETAAGCNHMSEWILLPLLCRTEAQCLRDLVDMDNVSGGCNEGSPWKVAWIDGSSYVKRGVSRTHRSEESREAVKFDPKLLSYRYEYAPEVSTPSKMTATQLKGRLVDRRIAENTREEICRSTSFAAPIFLSQNRKLTAAERGTAMHQAMHFLNFAKTDTIEEVQNEIERMKTMHFLSEEQAAAVDAKQIWGLFASPIGQELRTVRKEHLFREYRFSVLKPAAVYVPEIQSDDQVLLQGAVDCFYETDDGITVIDYKTDRICAGQEKEKAESYRVQLETYSDVLSEIFDRPVTRKILYFFATGQIAEL